jgi:hypothetical protein
LLDEAMGQKPPCAVSSSRVLIMLGLVVESDFGRLLKPELLLSGIVQKPSDGCFGAALPQGGPMSPQCRRQASPA